MLFGTWSLLKTLANESIKLIQQYPRPKIKLKLIDFLGFMGYFRQSKGKCVGRSLCKIGGPFVAVYRNNSRYRRLVSTFAQFILNIKHSDLENKHCLKSRSSVHFSGLWHTNHGVPQSLSWSLTKTLYHRSHHRREEIISEYQLMRMFLLCSWGCGWFLPYGYPSIIFQENCSGTWV